MAEFLAACRAALPGAMVSLLISGLFLYYLRTYIDHKLKEDEERRKKETQLRTRRSQLEQQRRRALGRLLFWLHRGVTHPPPNGELEKAMGEFETVEDELKALDQKILAEFEIGGGA